jgi:hypothetical protein
MARSTLLKQLEGEPVSGMQGKQPPWWADKVIGRFNERQFFNKPATVTDLKVEVIEYARRTWIREFSLSFADCTVRSRGQTHEHVTVLVNSHGLLISAGRNDADLENVTFDTMVEISDFADVTDATGGVGGAEGETLVSFKVACLDKSGSSRYNIEIASVRGGQIQEALDECFRGIIFRSKYCIATKIQPAHSSRVAFDTADLIVLESIFAGPQSDTVFGICERTNLKGQVPITSVFVCAVLRRPSAPQMALYASAASNGLLNRTLSLRKSIDGSMLHL